MRILLPYDKKTIPVEIPDQNFVGSLFSRIEEFKPGKSQEELVETSLDTPIGSLTLEELVKGKKNIVIISSAIPPTRCTSVRARNRLSLKEKAS
jgi:nickel-dependent lactate racemase